MKLLTTLLLFSAVSFSQDALRSLDAKQTFDVNECASGQTIICKPFSVSDENRNTVTVYRKIFRCFAYGSEVFNVLRSEANQFYKNKSDCEK